MKVKKIIKFIEQIKKQNPYPEDVFIEPTKRQYLKIHKLLEKDGLTLDKFSGACGRKVWDNCCNKIIEMLKERSVINNEYCRL